MFKIPSFSATLPGSFKLPLSLTLKPVSFTSLFALALLMGLPMAGTAHAQLIPRKPVTPPAPAPSPVPAAPATPGGAPATPASGGTPVPGGRPLKDEDTDRLLKQLADIQTTLQGKRNSYNSTILTQLKEAGNSEEKSFQLWLDATKQFDWDEQGKTATEFAEWKRTKGKELHNPQFMTGVRLEVQYLAVLIVYSASQTDTDAPKAEAIAAAVAYLDDLTASARKLNGKLDNLNRNVLDGVIAKHLKLDASIPKAKNEAYRPGNVYEIYDRAIFPYYREKGLTTSLITGWQKLMDQEKAMVEAEKIPEKLEAFTKDRLPVLKWGMAREMYNAGQEDTGMAAMLGLIRGNMGGKQTTGWISEMTDLLKAKKEKALADAAAAFPPAAPIPAPASAGEEIPQDPFAGPPPATPLPAPAPAHGTGSPPPARPITAPRTKTS
jgi:hypothetical protein